MKASIKNKNTLQGNLSILCIALFSAWLLSVAFEGEILSAIMKRQNITGVQYSLIAAILHFLGLFTGGFFVKKYFEPKNIMIFSISLCILGSLVFYISYSILWYIALGMISYFSGIFIANWGIYFKVNFSRERRFKAAADVLIYSNIFMIVLNLISIKLSPNIALFLSIVNLVIAIIIIWKIENFSEEKTSKDNIKKFKDYNANILKPFIFLCFFILIISINSGLMYSVVNPAFSDYEFIANYWVVPYILAIIILRNMPDRANKSYILYIGLAMMGISYVSFMWAESSAVNYLIINAIMLAAFGTYDLFFWSVLGSFLDYTDNPSKILGIGLSMNVLGIYIGAFIVNSDILSKTESDKVSSIAFVVIFMVIIILPVLNKLLCKVFKDHEFLIKGENTEENKLFTPEQFILDLKDKVELTNREIEIIKLLLEGYTYKAVSKNLYISENTVKYHIKNIYQKFGVSSKMELINMIKED